MTVIVLAIDINIANIVILGSSQFNTANITLHYIILLHNTAQGGGKIVHILSQDKERVLIILNLLNLASLSKIIPNSILCVQTTIMEQR